MRIIKRYSNRKLYDTYVKEYITLNSIAHLIQQGKDIQVIDNVSGEDITSLTLTQIIMDQEKKNSSFLPDTLLRALIRTGRNSLNSCHEKLHSPMELIHHFDEEIDRRLQDFIERGEIAESAGKRIRDQLIEHAHRFGIVSWINEHEIADALLKHGVPSRDEYRLLIQQIENLTRKIEDIQKNSKVEESV